MLQHRHRPVLPTFLHQLVMRPRLYNTSMVEDVNLISIDNGFQSMGNCNGRSACHCGLYGVLDQLLRSDVQRRGGFIK